MPTSDPHAKLTIAIQQEAERRKEYDVARDRLSRAVDLLDEIAVKLETIGDLEGYTSRGKLEAFKEARTYVAPPALTASYDLQRELLARQAEMTAILDSLTTEVSDAAQAVARATKAVRDAAEPIEKEFSDHLASRVEAAEADLSAAFLKISAYSRSGPGIQAFSPKAVAALARSPRPIAQANSPRGEAWRQLVEEYSQQRRDLLDGVNLEVQ